MDRNEKLRLSADSDWCHCYKHGMFARFFEQGLWWFSHAVKPLKPMLERVKGGEPVVYGGLPISSLESLLEQGALQQTEATDFGWRWPYAARQLVHMRERLEVIRAFLILAWELKAVSHHALADLNARLDELGKQATGWQQWFEKDSGKTAQ